MGFDDAPFEKVPDAAVPLCGIVTSGTRFEGMLWGRATRDGTDATDALAALALDSKFRPQLHVVLLDGITVGGLNVVDLPALAQRVGLPCLSVMRRPPNRDRMRLVVERLADGAERWERIERAGPVHERGGFVFQIAGATPEDGEAALKALTDRGRVPEPLRLAHLIGSAVITGQSSKRA
ncbi:MAG: DUF99 family protein [Alphaproteobacteria bacterium]|nr:DUF99 family protein [Alphaproteobacteria bacterium]